MKNIQLTLTTVIVLSAIFLSGSVFAQVDSSSLPEAGLKPGDTLYFIDRTAEEVQKVFITDPIAKAEFSAELSQERLAEAVLLTEEGRMTDVERAVEMYAKEFGVAAETLMYADGSLNEAEVIRQKELLAKQATTDLAILDGVAQQAPNVAYDVSLVEAKTIDKQNELISSIATTDAALAEDIYTEAVDARVWQIRTKADALESTDGVATLDSSIRGLNTYLDSGRELGINETVDSSLNSVVGILSNVPSNTTTYTTDMLLNDGRADGARPNVVNSNTDGTVTADTGAPRNTYTSSNMGAPAYQSTDNAMFSWMNYILSR